MKIALVDFKDSFTHNVAHYLNSSELECTVLCDGDFDISMLEEFDRIILSPGPGLPSETNSMNEIIAMYHLKKPILGICLGMQGIAEFFNGKLFNLGTVMHGVQVDISVKGESPLFFRLETPFQAGLYHSWGCDISESKCLIADAYSKDGTLMSFHHVTLPVYGIQFHPESIMTKFGKQILENFVNLAHTNTTK